MREQFSVLRHKSFRRLWLAQAGSVLGDRIVLVATALYVIDLTGSASDLGIVLAAQALPLVGLLIVGGLWADRLPRARLMLVSDVIRGVLQAAVAILILLHATQIWQLVVVGLLFGAAEAFARPAYTGLVPQTVPEDEIQDARAMTALTENLAELLGPAVGTALVVGLGAGAAFGIDGATFFISAVLLAGVRPRVRATTPPAAQAAPTMASIMQVQDGAPQWRREIAAGFAEVRKRVWVWATILGATAALLFGLAPLFVLGPLIAKNTYGSAGFYGVAITAFGAGAIVGAFTGLRWRPSRPLLAAHLLALLWPLIGITMALGAPRGVVLAVAPLGGFGIALFDVWWHTALSEHIPPDALSRVSSFDWMGSLALLPLGYAIAGPLADAIGADEVLLIGSALTILATLLAATPGQTRQLRYRAVTPAASDEDRATDERVTGDTPSRERPHPRRRVPGQNP